MVTGRYNNESGAMFVVGNGTDENNRSNAFEVYEDGRASVATPPVNDTDVVRLADLNTLKTDPLNIHNGVSGSNTLQQTGGAAASAESSAAFNQAKATAAVAFATGSSTASGWLSTATGYSTTASHSASFTAGQATQTGMDGQAVVGKYNLGTQGIFEVGCGTEDNRFNGLAVHPDGYLIIRRADGQYYNLNLILDALNGWVESAKIN
jgi:hypothetical protein